MQGALPRQKPPFCSDCALPRPAGAAREGNRGFRNDPLARASAKLSLRTHELLPATVPRLGAPLRTAVDRAGRAARRHAKMH